MRSHTAFCFDNNSCTDCGILDLELQKSCYSLQDIPLHDLLEILSERFSYRDSPIEILLERFSLRDSP